MVIGITGSSGSGKTTVAEIFETKLNAFRINADKIVYNQSQKGMPYFYAIINVFGNQILDESGNINKKLLGELIYSDIEKREQLNNLTFKYIVDEIKDQLSQFSSKDFIILDAPLLFESKLNTLCDVVISIVADTKVKIERIIKRDKLSEKVAKKRLKIQHNDSFFKEHSDFIVDNSNGFVHLIEQIECIISQLV